jgi:hypothetical protein
MVRCIRYWELNAIIALRSTLQSMMLCKVVEQRHAYTVGVTVFWFTH